MNETKNLETDIVNRSEILFLYDAKDCDPNGDPFTGEPRFDENTQKAMVSDVRLKRYIRDYIDEYESDEDSDTENKSKIVFYSSKGDTQTVGQRRESLSEIVDKDDSTDLLEKCIDIRLFGCVLAEEGNNIDLTGTVQFKNMNRSINKVELNPLQNTSVMKSGEEKTQGAIATNSQVPYALFSTIGYINPKTAEINGTKQKDIYLMLEALWNKINLINTRSKAGQTSRLLLKINYSDGVSKMSDIEKLVKVDSNEEQDYREFSEIEEDLDFNPLVEAVNKNSDKLDSIEYKIDETQDYENTLEFINKLKDVNEVRIEKLGF
ncbi:MAG: CRISPR-Cas system related protein Cas7, RAMP superfamily [Candidatus Methanohalarchaeum thermophilum]|uniref:CRISPR-Cas system related protein Cas7, RAMP superfamily n=1 Tax=Methanohalarchaeum thermophilum TaxID=1903181 RepID=A0A1Q6DWQ6_METT1|nr:MAG: CRISPR-Cas system related protein Cas7, RAMP superfamily [Candidatus Methanohalarchaeum thermophilum]